MIAFIDESLRVEEPGLYVLASAVLTMERVEQTRSGVVSALPRGLRRAHWRADSESRRQVFAAQMLNSDVELVAAVCSPIDRRRQERARRKALSCLVWEFRRLGVTELVIESRGSQDARDRAVLRELHRARVLGPHVVYRFVRASDDPLLWFADYAAGSVSAVQEGHAKPSLAQLASSVRVIDAGSGL